LKINNKLNILYIGQYEPGSTSRMRGETIKSLFPDAHFDVININIPFNAAFRLLRSFTFRFKRGPLIKIINKFVIEEINNCGVTKFDLIWIDKAIFITKKTTGLLRSHAKNLIHFTPDPAFTFHRSAHFENSLSFYDFAITTKSYELGHYKKFLSKDKIIITTQGYNVDTHYPQHNFPDKKNRILFIGHYEKEREVVLQEFLNKGISITLAGIKWSSFAKKNKNNSGLLFLGKGIYGEQYVQAISSHSMAWGAISKWIPELHTTRTFEIPACGTALITERNKETSAFFSESEAIFYGTIEEMIEKIEFYHSHPKELEILSQKGRNRVKNDGRDNETIIKKIFSEFECFA
jgi:glycosyltransferase involved in cell wall biosynthesis